MQYNNSVITENSELTFPFSLSVLTLPFVLLSSLNITEQSIIMDMPKKSNIVWVYDDQKTSVFSFD